MKWWEDPEKIKQRAENYKKNFRKKYGVDNPQQLKEIQQKTKRTCKKRYGGIGFASEELEKKSRDVMENRYGERNIMKTEKGKKHFRGDKNPQKDPDVRRRTSETMKEKIKEEGHWLKGKTYEEILGEERAEERKKEQVVNGQKGWLAAPRISAPQLELYNMVKEKYPTAVLEYPVLDYCLDIAVPELKLCFEYDGSYWHDPEKDKIRDEVLSGMGWTIRRFIDEIPTSLS